MPKMKSKGAVKKRFRVTKSGKVKCSHPGRGHMHAAYDGETRRSLRNRMVLNTTWSTLTKRMLKP
jgi:large subunit ribosomal protein L35